MYTSRWLLVHCKERWRIACLYSSSFFSKTIFLFTEDQNLLPLITYIWRNTVVGKLLPWKGIGLTLGSMDLVAAKAAVLSVKVFACTHFQHHGEHRKSSTISKCSEKAWECAVKLTTNQTGAAEKQQECSVLRMTSISDVLMGQSWVPGALMRTRVGHTPVCLVLDCVALLQNCSWHHESLKNTVWQTLP